MATLDDVQTPRVLDQLRPHLQRCVLFGSGQGSGQPGGKGGKLGTKVIGMRPLSGGGDGGYVSGLGRRTTSRVDENIDDIFYQLSRLKVWIDNQRAS